MTKGGSKHMIITVDTETGKVVEPVVDENGNEATRVDPEQIEKIYQSENGFKFVGSILHAESNPRCVFFSIGGRYYRICW